MKTCPKCHIEKDESEFTSHKGCRDGLRPDCKRCVKDYYQKYKERNNFKILDNKKKYYRDNKRRFQEYRKNNKEKIRAYQNKCRKLNIDVARKKAKHYYWRNRDKKVSYQRKYYQKYKDIRNAKRNEDRKLNPQKFKEQKKRQYIKHRDKINGNNLIKQKERVKSLHPYYLRQLAKRVMGFTNEDVKKIPNILEIQKVKVVAHRINKLKNKKNEKSSNSIIGGIPFRRLSKSEKAKRFGTGYGIKKSAN